MQKIIEVKPLKDYKVWIRFEDGVQGEVDLKDLVGQGVFESWKDPVFFNSCFIDQESHTIAWDGGIDLCPDMLYAEVLGKDPLEILNNNR